MNPPLVVVSPVLDGLGPDWPLWKQATANVVNARGGRAYLSQVSQGNDAKTALERLIGSQTLFSIRATGQDVGLLIYRNRVIEALYVAPHHRRQGVGREVLRLLLASEEPPLDAWALPGDLATKSLYESIGWKARLLTMRAGS